MATSPIDSVSNNTASTTTAGLQSAFNGDDFMKLLLIQLKNQDPLNPMKDQEFMTQLTQMNTLSAMQTLNTNVESLTRGQAITEGADLIGKKVQAQTDAGVVVATVQAVHIQGSDVYLDLGQAVVKLSDILAIGGAA